MRMETAMTGYNVSPDRQKLNFMESVTKAFAFLEALGFTQVEASAITVRYRKGEQEVSVWHEPHSYELDLRIEKAGVNHSIHALMRAAGQKPFNWAARTSEALESGVTQLAALT